MKILMECQNCCQVWVWHEDMDCCPECGSPELIEVKKDWNKE